MLLAIILIPFIFGALSFKLKPKLLWIVPLSFVFIAFAFSWECYLLYLLETRELYFKIPFYFVSDTPLNIIFKLDFISMIMGATVMFITFVILIYSLEFLSDTNRNAVIGFICLASAMMLIIIFSSDLVSLYFGWTGLCFIAYFMISSRNEKLSSSSASLKMLVINSIGDMFFLFSFIMLFVLTGSSEFSLIFDKIGSLDTNDLKMITIFMLIGVVVRSAGFGFHVWVPDAVVAPNSANAILHSCTFIVSGICVAIKMYLLFEIINPSMQILLCIGLATYIYAGVLACVQSNIKRVVSYASVSQIGMMMFTLGLGYPMMTLLLLMFYGLYITMLYLDVGAIVKGLSSEEDINKMGGVINKMPIAYIFMILTITFIAFIPFFVLLYIATTAKISIVVIFGILVAQFFTSGYLSRILLRVFHGKQKEEDAVIARVNEKNPFIIAAIIMLLVFVFVSLFYVNQFFVIDFIYRGYLVWLGLFSIFAGFICAFYSQKLSGLQKLKRVINDRKDFEELYRLLFIKPFNVIGKILFIVFDKNIIGGIEKLFISQTKNISNICGKSVTVISSLLMVLGIVGIVFYVFIKRGGM